MSPSDWRACAKAGSGDPDPVVVRPVVQLIERLVQAVGGLIGVNRLARGPGLEVIELVEHVLQLKVDLMIRVLALPALDFLMDAPGDIEDVLRRLWVVVEKSGLMVSLASQMGRPAPRRRAACLWQATMCSTVRGMGALQADA